MAVIKKYGEVLDQPLSNYQTFVTDVNPLSEYFRITEFKDTFTGGKNGFLIEGSKHLLESTEIKIQILDVEGNSVYWEPGNGIPEYYEGLSKVISVYVYEDTPIGIGSITILGELKSYTDELGNTIDVPAEWKGIYNVKWNKSFQINRLLSNEDKVRFYKRPLVNIAEIVKPIFNNVVTTIIQTGSIDGIAQAPRVGQQLAGYSAPTTYLLSINDTTNWTGSAIGTYIDVPSLGYSALANSVINNKELLVQTPYTLNGLVDDFENVGYTASFNYVEGVNNLKTALTGSFAKINITELTTFVGDVARVKIYRKSQSDLSDYQFIQEIKLESNELLVDLESYVKNQEYYGIFDNSNYKNYWVTSSNNLVTTFNQNYLFDSVKLNSTGVNSFHVSKSISITENTEYTLDFNLRVGNVASANYIKAFLSGSRQTSVNGVAKTIQIQQTIVNVTSDNSLLQKTALTNNFKAEQIDNAKLYFEVSGTEWYLADVSLRASQETSFSPNEITFIQSVPRSLPEETFLYRFEFYDINNNYIPVNVEATKTFNGGNLQRIQKGLVFTPRSLAFQFDSGSNPVPPTVVGFTVTKTLLTGSVTYTSQSFDFDGIELFADDYTASITTGGGYPGLLDDWRFDTPTMTVQHFTGSRIDKTVQLIKITGEVEGYTDSVIFTRVLDGFGGVNYLIRPYRGTQIRNSSTASLEVQAIRVDGINDIELSSLTYPLRGWPDKQLHIISRSADGSEKFVNLEYASSSKYVIGLSTGSLGTSEINYNATFNRDSIDFRRTIYLISSQSAASGPAYITSASVLSSVILEDLQDGLDSGIITYNADSFTINPRTESEFKPTFAFATASFAKRGTAAAEIESVTASFQIYPSMSINKDWVPEYWLYYHTQSLNPTITVVGKDENNNIIPSQIVNGNIRNSLNQTKNLTLTFTYTEPWTSASVSIDKTFTIVPEGKQGDESIVFEVNPIAITLGANSRGIVNDYTPSITDIKLKQGSRYLAFSASAGVPDNLSTHGTFHIATASIIENQIKAGNVHFTSSFGTPYTASLIVSQSSNFTQLSGSITYPLIIHPYYTSSIYTASVVVNYTKILEGAPPIQILLTPAAVNIEADEVGYVTPASYTAANTTIQVKEGDDFLTFTTQSTVRGTWRINKIESSGSLNTWNIRTGSLSSSSLSTATINYNRFDYPFVSASALYTIQVYPYALGAGHLPTSSIYERTQKFTKNVSPAKARTVTATALSQTITYDRDTNAFTPEGDNIITATAFNTTGSVYYYWFDTDGNEIGSDPTHLSNEFNPNDYTGNPGPGEVYTYVVKITDGNQHTSEFINPYRAESSVSVSGVKQGADAYKLVASNESTSITADLWTTQFTGTGMKITTFKGTNQLANVNPFVVSTMLKSDYSGIPIGYLGYSSASIFSKSSWINASVTTPTFPISNPAEIGNITFWAAPATNTSGQIVYKIDFEGGAFPVGGPAARQTQFVTQSIAVQFTPPAAYDIKMENENSSAVYRVSGELEFTSTGNRIRVYRGGDELVNTNPLPATDTDAYGTTGLSKDKCRVSISSYDDTVITLGGGFGVASWVSGTPATMPPITSWSDPENNPVVEIVYQINCEGRETFFKTQSLSIQYEGNVGPGIVMRGEWSQLTDYIGSHQTSNSRRDAVIYSPVPGTTKYYAAVSGSGPNTYNNPTIVPGKDGYYIGGTPPSGYIKIDYQAPTPDSDTDYWQYLGQEEFFVAAKIAIFEESYVKNTLNVGTKDGTSGFANIILAGGRPDPYLAIGQNATVGTAGTSGTSITTTGVIGYDRPGIFLGIYEDGAAGTTGRFSIKTTGTSGKGMFWDGDKLTIVGSIRQVEPGVSEGSLRGAWTSGFTYYTNDIVSYGGQSWRCTSAQAQNYQHIATNNTNALTGYPGSGPWDIAAAAGTSGTAGTAGTAGGPGAGVVYRGVWTQGTEYFKTTERTDVVKGSDDQYYIALSTHTPGDTTTRPIDGASYLSYWKSFGATFSSVATGLLLAENATITKGLTIGISGTETGFIRSVAADSITTGTGFYIDANGSVRFGDNTTTGDNYVYWNGDTLAIKGTVNISDGSVGGWTVDTAAEGGSLHDANSRIVLNPTIPELQMYDTAGKLKVQVSPKNTLTDTSVGANKYVSDLDSSLSAAASTTSNSDNQYWIYSAYSTNTPCTAFTIAAGETGVYEVNGIYSIPQINITSTGLPSTTATTTSPNYEPPYPWSTHNGYASAASAEIYLYMEFVNSSNVVIHRQTLNYGYAYGATVQPTYYYAVDDPYNYSSTGYIWAYYNGYSTAASVSKPTAASPYSFQVNFPTAGNYTIRYSTRVGVRSGKADNVSGDGSRTYSYTSFSKAGVAFSSTLDSNIDIVYPANFVEITAGGFQAVTDSTQFIQIIREESGGTNPTLLRIQGGQATISHTDTAQYTLSNNAISQLYGKVLLGYDWSSDVTKPKTVNINGGLRLQTTYSYVNGGAQSTPTRLSPTLAGGSTIIGVRNSSGAYYQLPYYDSATYNDVDYQRYEGGHFVIIFNTDDNTSCFVRGLIQNVTTSTTNGYTEIPGGVCWTLFYQGDRMGTLNGSRSNSWVVVTSFDNNF